MRMITFFSDFIRDIVNGDNCIKNDNACLVASFDKVRSDFSMFFYKNRKIWPLLLKIGVL